MAGDGRGGGRGSVRLVSVEEVGEGVYRVEAVINGVRRVFTARVEGDVLVTPFGSFHLPSLSKGKRRVGRRGGGRGGRGEGWLVEVIGGRIVARLPVRVVEAVEAGSRVSQGDVVAVVETMKMLNEIHAPCSGVVRFSARPGEGVAAGSVIVEVDCVEGG